MAVGPAETALLNAPHNYINPPSNAWKVTVADSVGLVLAVLCVAIRCFTKLRITKSPGSEDVVCVVALLMFIVFVACDFVQRFKYGGGRHTVDVPKYMWNGWLTMGAIDTYLYVLGTALAKVSILLFLWRIFRVEPKFRIAAWTIGTVLVVWSLITFLLGIFGCHPIKANWNVSLYLDTNTHCYPKIYDVVNYHGFCNIITDFALLFLPLPMLWRLQMDRKKKLGVGLVLANIESSICAIAIIRQKILWTSNKVDDGWQSTRIKVWMGLEFSMSIVVACLPIMAPFVKRYKMLASFIPSSIRSKFSSRSGASKQSPPWSAQKLPGSIPQGDVERGAMRSNEQRSHKFWQIPRSWNEHDAEKTSGDGYGSVSEGSEVRLQPVLPTYREIKHRD